MIEFIEPWREDMSYMSSKIPQNELGIDIATVLRPNLCRMSEGSIHVIRKSRWRLFIWKLHALNSMLHRLQPVQKRESGVTANVLLSLIDRMREEVSPLPMRYSWVEANAYGFHGRIALEDGTEESARRAVAHFENQLEV
jgi:hypothetical protein